jgi:hypothetical protein
MRIQFTGDMFEWRGPAPFCFVRVPDDEAVQIRDIAEMVSYGWGVIPATVTIGTTTVTTSLFPKDGGYLVPIKSALRLPEKIELGNVVDVILDFAV